MQPRTETIPTNYRVTSPKEVEKLFPEELTATFRRPKPDSKEKLIAYTSKLIEHQNNTDAKLLILSKAVTIDFFNEEINYWIINKAFEIAPFDHKQILTELHSHYMKTNIIGQRSYGQPDFSKGFFDEYPLEQSITFVKSPFHIFLLRLTYDIPHSPFLWFYLQHSLNKPLEKTEWSDLFNTYTPANITQTMKEINPGFAHRCLSCSTRATKFFPELNNANIEYALGNYQKTVELSSKVLSLAKTGRNVSKQEFGAATCLLGASYEHLFKTHSNVAQMFPTYDAESVAVVSEFTNGNYKKAITLCNSIISSTQQSGRPSTSKLITAYYILGRSHDELGEHSKALEIFKEVYPLLVSHSGKNHEQTKLVCDAIERLTPKVKTDDIKIQSNAPKSPPTELFKKSNPRTVYNSGLAKYKNKEFQAAINLINEALALFIDKKGETSAECAACYSTLASAYRDLSDIENAHSQCVKAYDVAHQVYKEEQPERLAILKKLRQLELTLSINKYGDSSNESAKAHENLGMIYEKTGEIEHARGEYTKAYQKSLEILGEKDSQTQEISTKLENLNLTFSQGK